VRNVPEGGGARVKVDWGEIETEYVTTQTSQRALAKKHGVSFPQLTSRSIKGTWVKKREAYQSKTIARTLQRTAEAKVDVGVECHEYLCEAARIFSQAFPVMAARIVAEADVRGADIYSRTLNSHIDNLAKLFGTAEDHKTIHLVMSDALKELSR
jgi:hypothetical protein